MTSGGLDLEQKLRSRRGFIGARALGARPGAASCLPDETPACSGQGNAGLISEDVCAYPLIAESECSSGRRSVEEGTGIARSICTEASDFQRPAIITHPSNRAADDGNTDDFTILHSAEREFMPDNRLVMAMVPRHEFVGIGKLERNAVQGHRSASPPMVAVEPVRLLIGPLGNCKTAPEPEANAEIGCYGDEDDERGHWSVPW